MNYGNDEFLNLFYYEHTRPSDPVSIINMAKGFLISDQLRLERKVSAGVVGIYKAIENESYQEVSYFHKELMFRVDEVSIASAGKELVNGARDDSKQVLISVLTAIWHAD